MTDHDNIEEILERDGYVVLPQFLDNHPMKDMFFQEVEEVIEKSIDDSYKFGKAERIGSLEQALNTRRGMYYCFTTPLLEHLKKKRFGKERVYTEIFVTNEFTNQRGIERNGYLHYDRLPTFKYFYYISDVIETGDGPLTLVPGTHKQGKQLRESQANKPYEEHLNRIELDFPLIYENCKKDIKEIYGKKGTLIIFNTDIFHMGGIVSPDHERKVCRLHMRDRSY